MCLLLLWQKILIKKKLVRMDLFRLHFYITTHHWRTSGQHLKQVSEAWTGKETWMSATNWLVFFSQYAQFPLLYKYSHFLMCAVHPVGWGVPHQSYIHKKLHPDLSIGQTAWFIFQSHFSLFRSFIPLLQFYVNLEYFFGFDIDHNIWYLS